MISSANIVLRPWKEADIALLTTLRNDVELQKQLLSRPRGSQENDVRAWAAARSGSQDQLFFVIALKDDDSAAGYLQFSGINPVDRKAELGICLAPARQKHGMGREAIELAAAHLHQTWNIRKLHLRVVSTNTGAIRCYLACGFAECGRYKEDVFLDGAFHDVVLMERFLSGGE